jgi:hypothetical protein
MEKVVQGGISGNPADARPVGGNLKRHEPEKHPEDL